MAVAIALSACTTDRDDPPPAAVPAAKSAPTPRASVSSIPRSPAAARAEAVSGASEAYRHFIAATDTAYASGGVNVGGLKKYATGVMLKAELNQAEIFRGRKWHSIGRQRVVWVKPLTVGTPDANGQINEVTVQACVDAATATAVDASGKSVKLPGTPTEAIDEMRMRRVQGAWKAEYPQSRKAGTC
ncbi:hypothetical protein AB0H36_31310 [Kribbella sp. NPDC050820]|uniref:hypothetical protein n=1 Tax=Kribbella sp. NPDC050820 TaxID=3155408 RepID=UPI0033E69AD8